MATVQVSLSSKLLDELTQNPSVKAYAVHFSNNAANWTPLTSTTTPVTLSGAAQKLYFIIQSSSNADDSVETKITTEADISPVGAATSADKLNYRYDSFEVSLQQSAADVGNLTDIVGFGIPMAISVGYGPSTGPGAVPTSSATRGYVVDGGTVDATGNGSGLWKKLYDIGGSGSIQFFTPVSGGYATTQPRMAISPATAIGNNVSGTKYSVDQWAGYTSSLYAGAGSQATASGAPGQIQIAGYYTGGKDAANIHHNGGYYAYDLTYSSGTSSFILTPGATSQIRGTITLTQQELNNSIYTTLGSATVDGMDNGFGVNSATLTMNTGYNNAWGTVLRDFIAGFTAGYWNTTATSLNPALSGTTIDLNKEWNQDPTYAFGGLVSSGAGAVTQAVAPLSGGIAYDAYAQEFFRSTNSYGNGYSDFLGRSYSVGPLISVWDQVLPVPIPPAPAPNANWIGVTLFSDADSGSALSGYTAPVINNYVSGGYTAVTGVNSGGPLHQFDFGVGTMTLKPDADVTLVLKSHAGSSGDIRVPLVASGGTSGFASAGTYGANYTISASGGGYAAHYTGANNAGFINITGMPITSGTGTVWYQIEVGSGGNVSKIFNLYEKVTSGQIHNPAYSGQAGDLAIDGLAVVVANGSATDQFVANNASGGQVSVNFQDNIVNSIDPALMAVVPFPSSGAPQKPYTEPTAPVVGWRPGSTSSATAVFRQMYDVWSAQSFTSTSSGSVPTSTPQTVYNGGLVFGWNGADSEAQQQQYGLKTPNYYLAGYTNKIGGGNVARLVFTAVSGDLPTSGLSSSTVDGNTIHYLIATADNEGTWQTVTPVQFANGTYTVQMQEFATSADASAGVRALNGASDVQSFTVAQGAVISNYNLSVDAVTSTGLVVASGGGVTVNSGGTTSATLVEAGGFEHVAWGSDDGSFVASGGSHAVWAGQTTNDLEVFGGGNSFVYGSSLSATLDNGASQYIVGQHGSSATPASNTSALDSFTMVFSGARQYVYGLASSGAATVAGTGIASGTTVQSGASQIVSSGGVALGVTIGGNHWISGGVASNTLVDSGGVQTVLDGGSVMSTSATSGATLNVMSGGSATAVWMSGAMANAASGGVIANATVLSGVVLNAWSGGRAVGATMESGSRLHVYSGGFSSAATIQSASVMKVWGSGSVDSGTAVKNGAVEHVYSSAATISGSVGSGGLLSVFGGGTVALSKTVDSGGLVHIHEGASIISATLTSGSVEKVWGTGSLASAATIQVGASEYVYSGASALGATVFGEQWIWDQGTTATNTTVHSGGAVVVHGGGMIVGGDMYGGQLTMGSGASAGGTVTVFGSSLFTLHGTGDIGRVSGASSGGLAISGFTSGMGTIDFDDIDYTNGVTTAVWSPFSAGATSGTLTITSGTLHAAVTLFGIAVASNDQFQLGTDGHGTTVTTTASPAASLSELLAPPHA